MAKEEAIVEARRLVRAAKSGALATIAEGQPFVSLVTACPAPDLSPLLWLSSLSAHSRHLKAEPRCSLMLEGRQDGPNPQKRPRVTLLGEVSPVPEAQVVEFKQRFLARHPYASLHAEFTDFTLWKITISGAHFVGGFAQAMRFRPQDLLPDPAAVAAITAAEPSVLAHVNARHAPLLALIAAQHDDFGSAPAAGAWRLTALDPDGFDLSQGETVLRFPFDPPLDGPDEIEAALLKAGADAVAKSQSN
ncbi:pyridoxamine 5'-phosphate oxidase family protein [Acetobacteraceae bacterium H6797]|nr:pyridoxamine 5'-phosphate oxidase family protein [Acetobacteraceae bacterium H6797]